MKGIERNMKQKHYLFAVLLIPFSIYFSLPFHWLPETIKKQHYQWFGLPAYQAKESVETKAEFEIEDRCPTDRKEWRKAQVIEGVEIQASETCLVDNPYLIAAAVKGTNNVSIDTLMQAGLAADAIVKGKDLDGDGDSDEIHIRLEVIELNGGSPDLKDDIVQFNIAPGITPGLWVFAPKSFGMSTENFDSLKANPLLRAPSPSIRIEQNDKVKITLENAHYMPHTIHLHGVDHPFVNEQGEGNDGVPSTSELPTMPGKSHTYIMQPRQTGTMYYHCHVHAHIHVQMGLQGMIIVEENKPNNSLQTINVGAGHVRHPSQASKQQFDSEYDLHYQSIDKDLNDRIKHSNDARHSAKSMHNDYDIAEANNDYYLLNGKSFPYTSQESIIVVNPNERIKLRILNGSDEGISLHTHGHKFTETHYDGVQVPKAAQITRDVGWIASGQRADYLLQTVNDGLHSYGEGIWPLHNHIAKSMTNDGIGPGGASTMIVYKKYLSEGGFPKTLGVDWNTYFIADYYKKTMPVWSTYDEYKRFAEAKHEEQSPIRFILLSFLTLLWLFCLTQLFRKA